MPHKDPDTRRAYHRNYWHTHPKLLEKRKTPEALQRRRDYDQKRYSDPTFRMSQKDRFFRRQYGLSLEQVKRLLKKQKNKCCICNKNIAKTFHVDHDHKCCANRGKSCGKCVRGLLCSECNTGIGLLRDSIPLLQKAIAYLRRKER